MSIFDRLKQLQYNKSRSAETPPAAPALDAEARAEFRRLLNGPDGMEALSEKDALTVNTVFACVNIISGAVASLPFDLYRRTADGREKATDHRLYKLCKFPSLDVPGFNFKEALLVNLLVYGNAVVEIVRTGGQIRELNLIPSEKVTISTNETTGTPEIQFSDGSVERPGRDLMLIAGMSLSGKKGLSPVDQGMASVKLSKALEAFGLSYFQRGARPAGFLKTARKLSEDAVKRLKRTFFEQYAGMANSGKVVVLEDGLDYQAAQNGNDSSQFLQTREMQIAEIARLFNIPLFMLSETTKSTSWGSGIEQLNISFVTHCLTPYLKRIEEAFNFYLLSDKGRPAERDNYYFEFNTEGLLRGDVSSRFGAYHTALTDGWLSPNEIRRKENLPDIDGGNVYYLPLNMGAYAGPDAPADNKELANERTD